MNYFCVTKAEIATLPYIEFHNKYHEAAPPGRSYEHSLLRKLVHTKFAFFAGMPAMRTF
ncbi:hypothetical protein B0H10DRAFT_2022352 [Mycena sp. CBHHK59/15]|nr:hypothetical protein B0H10DRAFT_2022352 [Mycena sp. CBHHK59/15]